VLALLAFDSVDRALVERLLREGRLPALAALTRRGEWLSLETPARHFAGEIYQSLYTGLEVGDARVVPPFPWSPAEQRVRYRLPSAAPPAVWERTTASGRSALVVDPYESPRPRALKGICLSGWQFRDRIVLPAWSVPDHMHRTLGRRLGRPRELGATYGRPSVDGLLDLRRRLLAAPGRVADAITHVLARDGVYDFLLAVFSAAHLAGHSFWDLSHLSDADLAAARARELERTLADVYVEVDAALGRIVAALPAGSDVVVFSPLGMGANTSRSDLLPQMLAAVLGKRPPSSSERSVGGGAIWRVRSGLSVGARRAIGRAIPDGLSRELVARLYTRGLDWTDTRAFALPSDHTGYVRLNLRGREREGIVAPAEADALMDELAEGLSSFEDPDGSPSVAAVERIADVVGARDLERPDSLPDLIVRWSDRPATRLAGVASRRFGDVLREGAASGRSGNHTADAWAVVVPGTSEERRPGRRARIVDLSATVCAVVGAETEGLAGEPLLERARVDRSGSVH
jgi:predicted AlkP superfamily phosphohydrolase/phosphomutase